MKKLSIFGGLSLGLGLLLLLVVYFLTRGDFSNLNGPIKSRQTEFSPAEIKHLDLDVAFADVELVGTDQETVKVAYEEDKRHRYHVTNDGGTLTVHQEKENYFFIPLVNFDLPFVLGAPDDLTVKVEVPKELLQDLKVDMGMGEMSLSNLRIKGKSQLDNDFGNTTIGDSQFEGDLAINLDAGNLQVSKVQAKSAQLSNDMGEVSLEQVDIAEEVSLKLSAGEADIEGFQAGSLNIDNELGDVRLINTTVDNQMEVHASDGDIQFSQLLVGKSLNITNELGSIKGNMADEMDNYSIISEVELGDNNLPSGLKAGPKQLEVQASAGDIAIDFKP